jgi:hypothetical protein
MKVSVKDRLCCGRDEAHLTRQRVVRPVGHPRLAALARLEDHLPYMASRRVWREQHSQRRDEGRRGVSCSSVRSRCCQLLPPRGARLPRRAYAGLPRAVRRAHAACRLPRRLCGAGACARVARRSLVLASCARAHLPPRAVMEDVEELARFHVSRPSRWRCGRRLPTPRTRKLVVSAAAAEHQTTSRVHIATERYGACALH